MIHAHYPHNIKSDRQAIVLTLPQTNLNILPSLDYFYKTEMPSVMM